MLELTKISYAIKGGSRRKILDQLSLRFQPNSLTVITGPNGSGKSTLAEIIMGLKVPTSGQIFLDGEDLTKFSSTDRAKRGLAYSFQQPVTFKGITVYDLLNIANGELISPTAAAKHLQKVGLTADYLPREVNGKLSGGELKRVEIASVLARNTKVVILDEPEAGIDLWSFRHLLRIFKKLKTDKTVIIISHQEKILQLADRIIVLEDGKVKQQGAPTKILPSIGDYYGTH